MKKIIISMIIATCIIMTSIAESNLIGSEPVKELRGAYLGQTPPGTTPKVFAPGFISISTTKEWSCTFSPDGKEIFFYRIDTKGYCTIFYTKVTNGIWPEPKEFPVSKGYSASTPCITLDNSTLYFEWSINKNPEFYMVKRTDNGWSKPALVADLGMYLSSSLDGTLFTTDMSELFINGKTFLKKITVENGIFKKHERVDIVSNLGRQTHPCIAPDGSYILFDIGGKHLFVSFRKNDGSWGEAIDLGKHGFDINSGGAYVSPDGLYLFFQLNGDIYWVSTNAITALK